MRARYTSGFQDLEELGVRFEEFRGSHRSRERLPEELWAAAAEIAMRRGLNITARALRLDSNNLKKRMGQQTALPKVKRGRRKKTMPVASAAFLELLAPVAGAATSCMVEVDSAHGGKLRMELKGLGTLQPVDRKPCECFDWRVNLLTNGRESLPVALWPSDRIAK